MTPGPPARRFALAAAMAASIGLLAAALPAGTGAKPGPASDEAALRALHAKVIQAHRESNPDLLFEDVATDFVQANRGEIKRPTIEERRTRFAACHAVGRMLATALGEQRQREWPQKLEATYDAIAAAVSSVPA